MYLLDKLLGKIKEILGIEKFDDPKILVDTDDKMPDDISSKNVVTLLTCFIKIDGKFYPQILSEEALFIKYTWHLGRLWDWGMPEDEKKEKPFLIDWK